MIHFVTHMMSEPAFDILRTQEQLGYVVHTSAKVSEATIAIQFIIQGDGNSPQHVDARIEAFIATFRTMLANMPAAEFENHRTAVVEMVSERAVGRFAHVTL
jgi:secreted Zn-dependent insulinase-like peptidase